MRWFTKSAITVFIIYLGVSLLYIYLSDLLLNKWYEEPVELTKYQTYKGWGFVVITALLIFYLVNREVRKKNELIKRLKWSKEEYQEMYLKHKEANIQLEKNIGEIRHINKELNRAKQKAEENDRLKSAFLANLSHQIRTPMNAIMGFSQLLKERAFEAEKQAEFLDLIYTKGKQLLQIIHDIVDLSKIESNQLDLRPEKFDVNDLIRTLFEEYKKELHDLDGAPIALSADYGWSKGAFYISGDSIRIRQVLENLLSNAIQYTGKGYVRFGYLLKNRGEVLFYVEDSGHGIPEEKQEVIFDRFRRGDESMSSHYEGTGLGLTISKNLVELMGGKIWLHSREGEGSTFFFQVPHNLPEPADHPTEKSERNETYDWQEKTILVVEDDPASQEYLKESLADTKARLLVSGSGEDAREQVDRNSDINLVLMDIRLPGISGLEVIREIRQSNSHIPIIAQTAQAMEDDPGKCLQAGANDYISKPIDINELLALIKQYI